MLEKIETAFNKVAIPTVIIFALIAHLFYQQIGL